MVPLGSLVRQVQLEQPDRQVSQDRLDLQARRARPEWLEHREQEALRVRMASRDQREFRVRLDLRVKMVNEDSLGALDSQARLVPEVLVDPRELPEVLEPKVRSVIPDFPDSRDLLEALELSDQLAYRELLATRVPQVREVLLDPLDQLVLLEHEDWMVLPVVLVRPAKQATPVRLVLEVSLVHRDPRAELAQLGLLDQGEQLARKVPVEQLVLRGQVET
jgi:hypothetical protein